MRIVGIGVDIIENKRIKNSLKNLKFKKRIYSIDIFISNQRNFN